MLLKIESSLTAGLSHLLSKTEITGLILIYISSTRAFIERKKQVNLWGVNKIALTHCAYKVNTLFDLDLGLALGCTVSCHLLISLAARLKVKYLCDSDGYGVC